MAKVRRAAEKVRGRGGVQAKSDAKKAAGRAVEPPADPQVDRALNAAVWPRVGDNGQITLVPGRRRDLSFEELERTCLHQLTKVLEQALLWDHRTPPLNWLVGDHTIVCVETEVAPDASLYVQFWCEPQEPVLWEVSSGHANPGARPFVKGEPARRLRAMGFRIGGAARNFCRQVSVGNRGDAAQVAGEVLRIYYEALGYRGRTPLVVHADRCRRSTSAPVLTGVTAEDVQKLLVRAGFSATIAEPVKGCPRLAGSHGELPFDVTLDARDEETGLYTAVDVDAAVGAFGGSDTLVFMNVLNSSSRVGSTWIAPKDRAVILGTSLLFAGGLTEAHIVERLQAWLRMVTRTMLDLAPTRARAKKGGKGGKGKKAAAGGRAGRQAARGAAGAGDTAVSGSRLVH